MKWPKLPEQPPPPPVRIVGASRRGDFNFGMYANVEKQVAAMMEQGYWPLGLTFKDDSRSCS
jgi:ribulose bisphosphate carboxylase small subunit